MAEQQQQQRRARRGPVGPTEPSAAALAGPTPGDHDRGTSGRRLGPAVERAPVVLDRVLWACDATIGRTDALLPRQGDRQQGTR